MDRVKNCEKKFKELFGGAPTVNEGNDPEFMRILQRFIFGEVCYAGGYLFYAAFCLRKGKTAKLFSRAAPGSSRYAFPAERHLTKNRLWYIL